MHGRGRRPSRLAALAPQGDGTGAENGMRLGMFMMPVHPPGRLFADTLAEDEEKSLYADRLGFDELWLGEHFSPTTQPIPPPLMFFASPVAPAKKLTFRTPRISLPHPHPPKMA